MCTANVSLFSLKPRRDLPISPGICEIPHRGGQVFHLSTTQSLDVVLPTSTLIDLWSKKSLSFSSTSYPTLSQHP